MIVHEGLRRGCGECDSTFVWHSDILKHVQSVHKGVRYDYISVNI